MQHQPVTGANGEATGEYRYEGSVANRALELLGKELGMFISRSEVRTGPLDGIVARCNISRSRARTARRLGSIDTRAPWRTGHLSCSGRNLACSFPAARYALAHWME